MKKLLLALSLTPFFAHADDVPAEDRATVVQLVQALEAGDKAAVAQLMDYPIARQQPLPALKNAKEFVARYEDFFDAGTIARIKDDAQNLWWSWRGTATGSGSVWISSGKVFALNVATAQQLAAAAALKKQIQAGTHPLARNYDEILFECKTQHHYARAQSLGDQVQYFSWKANESIAHKPRMAILKGEMEFQGSGGGAIYTFRNGDTTYTLEQVGVCGEDCNSYLTVTRGTKMLERSVCL